ncbi:MAG: TetR/AcrR family transcriptional regulator [Proteobacteria bacterium]|nr:MAG: TetR/AcrR family transcriptional regulator [Pseudomonadota bacterium]
MTVQAQIAERLEQAFSRHGFAEPSVADLKAAAGVSLRTLYRHFPSKEAMVIGALAHRHARYLDFLADGLPPAGVGAVTHLFQRLGQWMAHDAPHGCLSMNAFAAYPGHPQIVAAVCQHKQDLIDRLAHLSGRPDQALALFLLHEGASAAWPVQGDQAIHAAQTAALQLIEGHHP